MEKRKLAKKQKRKESLLLRREPDLGVRFEEQATAHILVGNGGVVNGITRTLLEEVLGTPHLYMPSHKDYAFATFSSSSQAEARVKSLNGVCLQSLPKLSELPAALLNGPPLHLYLSYITAIPDSLLDSTASPSSMQLPPGLLLFPDFITAAEEHDLIRFFESQDGHSQLKHRWVLHYGYEFNYASNSVDPTCPLPGGFPPLIQHLIAKIVSSGHVKHTPDQVTVNCYPPGAGIPPHVDTHSAFMEEIISISLGAQVVMDFRLRDEATGKVVEKVPVLLPGRSLLIMSGEVRYLWSHGIASRLHDQLPPPAPMTTVARGTRMSVTFRTVRRGTSICNCGQSVSS